MDVQIHSTDGDVVRTITLTKTGDAEGRIDIVSSSAPGSTESFQLKNVTADPASLTIVCDIENFPWGSAKVVVKRSAAPQPPEATIIVSHAILGNGTYEYPLKMGEDTLVSNFLAQANFAPLAA